MKRPKNVTLEDVAKLAKVSRATVSRVINSPDQVSEEVVKRTQEAIRELRYYPNQFARNLTLGRSKNIALVFFEDFRTMFTNPFWGEVLNSVYENLAKSKLTCTLLVQSGLQDQGEKSTFDFHSMVRSSNADGFIFFGKYPESIEKSLGQSHLPIVIFGKPYTNNSEFSYVDTDNIKGAMQAIKFLAKKGRRKIAAITGPLESSAAFDRYLGYKNGLIESGLKIENSIIANGDWSKDSGKEAMKTILKRTKNFDALFVASDLMAVGALEVLVKAKIKVPSEVAIVGFDNSNLAEITQPKLTSVEQPFAELGKELVKAVIRSMEGVAHQSKILGARVIEREST